jgi:hypothetical protein
MRGTSTSATSVAFLRLRFRLRFLHSARCRRPCLRRRILPVPVILNRLATPFRVLLLATFFLIRGAGRWQTSLTRQVLFWPLEEHFSAPPSPGRFNRKTNTLAKSDGIVTQYALNIWIFRHFSRQRLRYRPVTKSPSVPAGGDRWDFPAASLSPSPSLSVFPFLAEPPRALSSRPRQSSCRRPLRSPSW